ncbi:MAG: hypothetical protein J5669_01200 [Bacteroidales bacterium]|nr:hypothetical protein [Bacteroidales bacterium]
METKQKYSTPAIWVVKLTTEGIICDSSNQVMIWSLLAPSSIGTAEEMSRSDYGSANEI